MSTECSTSTEYHTSQQSDDIEQEQPSSQSTSSDVTPAADESERIRKDDLHNDDSQTSNATTITLSS